MAWRRHWAQTPVLLTLGTFAVSHQITAQLVICQEEKERARGHQICWRDTSLLFGCTQSAAFRPAATAACLHFSI